MAAATPELADTPEVPTHSSCWPGDRTGDYYLEVDAPGNFRGYIELHECTPHSLGEGPQGRERVIGHDLGHAAGLSIARIPPTRSTR